MVSLNVGLEFGHPVPAAALFLLACVLWETGRVVVMGVSRFLRIFAFVLMAIWLITFILDAVVQARDKYWNWFSWAGLCTVTAVVLASHLFRARRRTGASQSGETGTPPFTTSQTR